MSDQAEDFPEAAADPHIKDILRWTGVVLWWVVYPVVIGIYYLFYYITFAVLFVVKLLLKPIAFVLAPIIYLGQFVLACLAAPFHFIAKFEVYPVNSFSLTTRLLFNRHFTSISELQLS